MMLAMDELRPQDEIGNRQVVNRPNLGKRIGFGRGKRASFITISGDARANSPGAKR